MTDVSSNTPPEPVRRLWIGVVLYRNTSEELDSLHRSLEVARGAPGVPALHVAWLDNSPDASLRDSLERIVTGGVDYVSDPRNLGFGGGHNQLMRRAFAAGAEQYLCLNPDGILHPDCIVELLAEATRQARPGLVEAAQFPDEHPKRYDRRTHETPWASGCALLVSRELHAAVGGFDESFFMYCEDVDLSWRARAAGFAVAIAPRALVHHYVGDRPPGGGMVAQMLQSGAYLGAKYGSRDFTLWCQDELEKLGVSPRAIPAVTRASDAMRRAADFAHLFHFAEGRW